MANEAKRKHENTQNEGEGSRTAARKYNKGQQEFIKSGKVRKAATEAEKAFGGAEGKKLRKAEETGRDRAREFDPNEDRDYTKGSK